MEARTEKRETWGGRCAATAIRHCWIGWRAIDGGRFVRNKPGRTARDPDSSASVRREAVQCAEGLSRFFSEEISKPGSGDPSQAHSLAVFRHRPSIWGDL